MDETQGDEAEVKAESVDDPKVPASEAGGGKACALGSCSLSSPKSLSFLLPFIAVMLLDYFAVGPFCSGSVCHTCLWTKTALATLAGLAGLLIYHRLIKNKKPA